MDWHVAYVLKMNNVEAAIPEIVLIQNGVKIENVPKKRILIIVFFVKRIVKRDFLRKSNLMDLLCLLRDMELKLC